MQFKPLAANVWSVRIGDHYRALARREGDLVVWFWIGTHEDYNTSRSNWGIGRIQTVKIRRVLDPL